MIRFWGEELTGLRLSRSRPYHKNDNRLVEQKNDTLVTAYLGDGRLHTPNHVRAMNEMYDLMWVYYNLFQPVLHLVEKVYMEQEGKTKRKWDKAKTPYERLKQSGELSGEQQKRLDQLYEQTNPRALRLEIYKRLEKLWAWQKEPSEQGEPSELERVA
jgi:hypothetical protein